MRLTILFALFYCTCYTQKQEKTYFDIYFEGLSLFQNDSTSIEVSKADTLFQELFSRGKNQIDDVEQVIGTLKKHNFPIHENYYLAQVRESKNYLNYKVQTNDKYRLKRSEYMKLEKGIVRSKRSCKKKTFKLLRMLRKDQVCRKKKGLVNLHSVDSLNAIEVKKMLQDTTFIKELQFLNRSFIEIMILHGGWENYENEIDLIHYYVDQRYLNREFFAEIFERTSIGNGTLFKINDAKLEVCTNCSEKLCTSNTMYPSNTGNRRFYMNGNHIFVPVNPNLTIDELNRFRRYCFLPDYNTKTSNKNVLFPSISEWCLLNGYL